jgi:Zn-dependent M28 family amino/carboxypeptidase
MALRQWLPRGSVLALIAILALAAGQLSAANDAAGARMGKDITFLASDELEGRGVSTKGINLAADYIAQEFKKAGLKPATPAGSYFQPFTMHGYAKLDSPNTLGLRGPQGQQLELRLGTDFQVLGLSGAGKAAAPLVFVGYGITSKEAKYDDYQGLDVAGKIVIILRKTPRFENPHAPLAGPAAVPTPGRPTRAVSAAYYASLTTKLDNAERHKAAAVLFVNDQETARNADTLMDFRYTAFADGSKLPTLQLRRSVVDELLQSCRGQKLKEIEEDIDRDLTPRSTLLTGWTADLEAQVSRPAIHVKNVVGVLEGAGPLANETVIIGAHYDHLGYGSLFSLAPQSQQGKAIHHGADDNGSGTAMLMELARRFSQTPNRLGRRLVFIAFSGEESGLLGSAYYCKQPLVPLENTVAMVNMDMVGRLRADEATHQDKLIVYGTGSARTFDKLIDSLNAKFGFQIKKVASGMGPSDQQSFYVKNIPVYFFFTGEHKDYHRPSDTADKINLAGMAKVADLVENLLYYLQSVSERPQFVKVVEPASSNRPHMDGPRLGIMPSYNDDKEGVLLGGVSEGTPAAKAGLKEGDRIVEMDGKPVKNLEVYMALMAGHKKGDAFDVRIVRAGKLQTVKVKLE